ADEEARQEAADAASAAPDGGDPAGARELVACTEGRRTRDRVRLRLGRGGHWNSGAARAHGHARHRVQRPEHAGNLVGGDLRQPGERARRGAPVSFPTFNHHGVAAIYRLEMARAMRTLLQSLLTPVITTSLYFVVFGAAIGSRMTEVHGVPYGAFIVPGLIML